MNMKISCTQENLKEGLFKVSGIAGKNINLPILNNILLEVEEKNIKLSSTNLEIGVNCSIRGKVESEGRIAIPAKVFYDYVSLLPNEIVNLEVIDNELRINCQKYKTKIKGESAEEFPLIPQIKKENEVAINKKQFKEAVTQALFAVSMDETRVELSGILFNFNKGKGELTITATDSYRLAERVVRVGGGQSDFNIIIPSKSLHELSRILSGAKEEVESKENIEMYVSENQAVFSFNDAKLVTRLIDGQYPDYKQIIPTEHKTSALINTQEFLKTIKVNSLFAKSESADIILELKQNEITLTSINNQLGESSASFDIEKQGDDNKIILNFRYLIDGLNNIKSDEVIFEMSDSNNPCVLKPKDKNEYLYLIMPIKE